MGHYFLARQYRLSKKQQPIFDSNLIKKMGINYFLDIQYLDHPFSLNSRSVTFIVSSATFTRPYLFLSYFYSKYVTDI